MKCFLDNEMKILSQFLKGEGWKYSWLFGEAPACRYHFFSIKNPTPRPHECLILLIKTLLLWLWCILVAILFSIISRGECKNWKFWLIAKPTLLEYFLYFLFFFHLKKEHNFVASLTKLVENFQIDSLLSPLNQK